MEYAIKLNITNSRNDNESNEWFFCETVEEKDKWISDKKKEEADWCKTPGVVSVRYYDFDTHSISEFLDKDMSEFQHMTLGDFLNIIKVRKPRKFWKYYSQVGCNE